VEKYLKKILIISFMFIMCWFTLYPNKTYALDYENGHFKKIHTPFPLLGSPIKLKNGMVIILSENSFVRFSPQTNKFEKITNNMNFNILANEPGLLLNNGKILFTEPLWHHPSQKFSAAIYKLVINDLSQYKILKRFRPHKQRDYWYAYNQLPEAEKEKIYLPYIRKNPDLYKRYKAYLQRYELSMYARLYDPETGKWEYTGKIQLRRSKAEKLLLKNGNVLILGGVNRDTTLPPSIRAKNVISMPANFLELYNPDTGRFTGITLSQNFQNIENLILLNDGSVFIYADKKGYIFNPDSGEFKVSKHKIYGKNFVKLKDDNIIFSSAIYDKPRDQMTINKYNPHNDTLIKLGKLQIPRGDSIYRMTLVPTGEILITGGANTDKSGPFSGDEVYENRAEILNINTGETRPIAKMTYKAPRGYSVVLNDGRILFYFPAKYVNLYIPAKYKK